MLPVNEALAVVGLLALLLVAGRIGRARLAARRPQREAMELARLLARRGKSATAIAHQARLPHDVVTLTVHLTRVGFPGQKMPRAASPAAARQKLT